MKLQYTALVITFLIYRLGVLQIETTVNDEDKHHQM